MQLSKIAITATVLVTSVSLAFATPAPIANTDVTPSSIQMAEILLTEREYKPADSVYGDGMAGGSVGYNSTSLNASQPVANVNTPSSSSGTSGKISSLSLLISLATIGGGLIQALY